MAWIGAACLALVIAISGLGGAAKIATQKPDSRTSHTPGAASSFCSPTKSGVSEKTIALVRKHEGWSPNPYRDGGGFSVGYGTHFPLSETEGEWLLRHRLGIAQNDARALFENFDDLDGVRQAVLVDMSYQLGYNGLAGFVNLRQSVGRGDWATAKEDMLDSKWARQTPGRAKELAELMFRGDDVSTV